MDADWIGFPNIKLAQRIKNKIKYEVLKVSPRAWKSKGSEKWLYFFILNNIRKKVSTLKLFDGRPSSKSGLDQSQYSAKSLDPELEPKLTNPSSQHFSHVK